MFDRWSPPQARKFWGFHFLFTIFTVLRSILDNIFFEPYFQFFRSTFLLRSRTSNFLKNWKYILPKKNAEAHTIEQKHCGRKLTPKQRSPRRKSKKRKRQRSRLRIPLFWAPDAEFSITFEIYCKVKTPFKKASQVYKIWELLKKSYIWFAFLKGVLTLHFFQRP